MTPRREKLGNTGGVETSLGQTEGRTQTGTTGTDNNGIVLVVLGKQSGPIHSPRTPYPQGPEFAYNHGVLLRNVSIGLLSAQRLVGEYPGWGRIN